LFLQLLQLLLLFFEAESCNKEGYQMVLLALWILNLGIKWTFLSAGCNSIVDGVGALDKGGLYFLQLGRILLLTVASK